MTISRLRITARMLEPRVRSAAQNSSNVVFVPPPEKRSIAGMMVFQQALMCLREGKISSKPVQVQEGLWEFHMERYAANQWFILKVAAAVEGARVTTVYALLQEK